VCTIYLKVRRLLDLYIKQWNYEISYYHSPEELTRGRYSDWGSKKEILLIYFINENYLFIILGL
jgi:hypothetical protein